MVLLLHGVADAEVEPRYGAATFWSRLWLLLALLVFNQPGWLVLSQLMLRLAAAKGLGEWLHCLLALDYQADSGTATRRVRSR